MPDTLHDAGEIAAIVLAAGASSRFGADKLLHPVTLRGVTLPLAAHSLLPWLDTFAHVTAVIKPGAEKFCSAMATALGATKAAQIRWIVCAGSVQGMAASLVSGVRANHDAAAWLVGLADMPSVPAQAIVEVHNALTAGAVLAAPFCAGRRGHPVGFARHYRNELLSLQGDAGARRLLERDKENVVKVEIGNTGIFTDIDTPGDLQRL